MFQCAKLLKHKILIGLLYGCGLLEARSVRLQDLDFDRKKPKVQKKTATHFQFI
jgi:hypothetical protein